MKKKDKVLFLLIFFFPFFTFSQSPGYLGKKASLSISLSGFPAIVGPTQNNYGDDEHTIGQSSGSVGVNYEFEGNLLYAIDRYHSLGLYLGQYYTGVYSEARTFARAVDFPVSGGTTNSVDEHELLYRSNVRSLGLLYSVFSRKKGALAPVGNRFYLGLKYSLVGSEIIDKRTRFDNPELGAALGHEPLGTDTESGIGFLLLGWSNDLMVTDRFLFRSGFRFGVPLSYRYLGEVIGGSTIYLNYGQDNQETYDFDLVDRLARHELLRVDLGVGLLLF